MRWCRRFLTWLRGRAERAARDREEMYQVSVDCLATMMRQDATKRHLAQALASAEAKSKRRRFKVFTSTRIH